jgi:cyclase
MKFLKRGVLTFCGIVLCLTRAADGQQVQAFSIKQIAPGVWAAIADSTGAAGGNAGFVIGDDGVVVIDTFGSPFAGTEPAKQLLAEIRKRTTLPIKFVINTHYHADHVGGNGVFADAGAVVIAQRNVRDWIHPENLRMFGPDPKPEFKAFVEGLVAPTVGYDQSIDLYLGSRRVEVRSFPGHTGGDSVVFVPDAKAVFAGDLFWRNTSPNLIDATTALWIDTLDQLAKNASYSTFVPGHGDVGTTQDVIGFREYLTTLRKLVADARTQGKSDDALADAVMPALGEKYGQWDYFKYLAKPNIVDMDAELSGKKRTPRPGVGQ